MKTISLLIFITLFCVGTELKSQVVTKPISLELLFGGGFGKSFKTGIVTEKGSDVNLSIGGGSISGGRLGYRFDNNIEIFLSLSRIKSELIPKLSNASGEFSKTVLNPIITYKFSFNKRSHLNLGGGLRFSLKNEADLDASQIEGAAHNILIYKNSVGPSAFLGYELYLRNWFSFTISTSFFYHNYRLEEFTSNGNKVNIGRLNQEMKEYTDNIDGSGYELLLGFRFHI